MQPTHAEVARTLAAGHLPADAHIDCLQSGQGRWRGGRTGCKQGPFPVRHVTDSGGRALLLSPSAGALTAALRPTRGNHDTALVLDISDVPPVSGAPSLGRILMAGWATALTGEEARQAALDYADADAASDLLDVGETQVLHRMDIAEIRYERDGVLVDVDPDEYAAASPDPLRAIEWDLIADLADHHIDEMSQYVRRQLGPVFAGNGGHPQVVRLDRYGFVVRLGDRLARLSFPRPVEDRHDLAHLLHPILCHRCSRVSG